MTATTAALPAINEEPPAAAHTLPRLLLASLLLLLVMLAILLFWHRSENRLVYEMQASTLSQLELIQRVRVIDNSGDSAALRDPLDRLWNAHWQNANGQFAALQKRHGNRQLAKLYSGPGSLSANLRALTEQTRSEQTKPSAAPLSERLATIEDDLRQVASSVTAYHQRINNRLLGLALLILGALALIAALTYWFCYRPLYRKFENGARQLQQVSRQLNHLKRTDVLTDIGNRKAITEFLSGVREANFTDGEFLALAILDIDHFSQINDAMGYFAGDHVLQELAARIQIELRDGDKLGRLEGDKFAIVLQHLTTPSDAEQTIARIQRALMCDYTYREQPFSITTTVGASVQEMRNLDLAELFKLADKALWRAKQTHRSSSLVLSQAATVAISRQRSITNLLRQHPPEDLFDIVYQPIVSLRDRSITGCESLLRWRADEPGDLHPNEFVPLLEMFGEINRTGEWLLSQSLQDLARWQQALQGQLPRLAINVSARQLESDTYINQVIHQTQRLGLAPASVTIELTEGSAIKHQESGRDQLAVLRNHGFGVSLDDFGTGYCSLQYLKSMPASSVKIDRSFITDMLDSKRDAVIVESAINIAAAIGMGVIAEGVETEQQAAHLTALGCDRAQGFLFSGPLTADEFEALLKRNTG